MSEPQTGHAEAITCTVCGGQIQHVGPPALPEGFGATAWEGWFHVDKSREHFMPVGWYR